MSKKLLQMQCHEVLLKPLGVISRVLKSTSTTVLYVSERNSARGKMIDKRFSTIGHLQGSQAGRQMLLPWVLNGIHFFIIKGRAGRGRRPSSSFLSRHYVSIMSSSPRLDRGVFLFLYGQASIVIALWKNYFPK